MQQLQPTSIQKKTTLVSVWCRKHLLKSQHSEVGCSGYVPPPAPRAARSLVERRVNNVLSMNCQGLKLRALDPRNIFKAVWPEKGTPRVSPSGSDTAPTAALPGVTVCKNKHAVREKPVEFTEIQHKSECKVCSERIPRERQACQQRSSSKC